MCCGFQPKVSRFLFPSSSAGPFTRAFDPTGNREAARPRSRHSFTLSHQIIQPHMDVHVAQQVEKRESWPSFTHQSGVDQLPPYPSRVHQCDFTIEDAIRSDAGCLSKGYGGRARFSPETRPGAGEGRKFLHGARKGGEKNVRNLISHPSLEFP